MHYNRQCSRHNAYKTCVTNNAGNVPTNVTMGSVRVTVLAMEKQ